MSTVKLTGQDDVPKVGPPNTRRQPGRPHKKRVRTEDFGTSRKNVTCSRCHNQLGHNASTCREPLGVMGSLDLVVRVNNMLYKCSLAQI
ncbi:hypothetical protein V1525DRAFT_128613 [Lipomyces kononenkoae]|uniref:Uncharacterized protein n=1 Tax=Lipomyces kononenkoae TaxID=34357 RepID=A0ACC3SSM9_LIPKO